MWKRNHSRLKLCIVRHFHSPNCGGDCHHSRTVVLTGLKDYEHELRRCLLSSAGIDRSCASHVLIPVPCKIVLSVIFAYWLRGCVLVSGRSCDFTCRRHTSLRNRNNVRLDVLRDRDRSEEHTSELQS